MTNPSNVLHYEGCNFLRQRLLLSTLSGRPVKFTNIRHLDESPGLRGIPTLLTLIYFTYTYTTQQSFSMLPCSKIHTADFEVNLLKLIDQVTNGAKIDINATGTAFFYQPGLIQGGSFEFDCETERGIGYYLEMLLFLAPFCKKPLRVTLTGVTNCKSDLSPDFLKSVWLPVLRKFMLDSEDLDIKVFVHYKQLPLAFFIFLPSIWSEYAKFFDSNPICYKQFSKIIRKDNFFIEITLLNIFFVITYLCKSQKISNHTAWFFLFEKHEQLCTYLVTYLF